ncbi:MAG TPA: NFACT RNA binding domain-containing protein, partial [Nitrososphaerales archaeon]|nr:NFACT RNA binding domain-containing protein [Nitrososphaerales archaeon]
RSLVVGAKYSLPPTRGIPLQDIDFQKLLSVYSTTGGGAESLSAVRWFGRTVGTSRKFVEEIFFRANIDPEIPAKSLLPGALHSLADASESLRSDLQKSNAGNILVPNEESDLEIDVCQIVPNSWKILSEQGLVIIRSFLSLSEALDEVQVQSLVLDRKRSVSKKARAKASELGSAITKQASQIELNKTRAAELRKEAEKLMKLGLPHVGPESEIAGKLKTYDLIEVSEKSGNQGRFVTEPRSFLKSYSGTALASRLFDEAKRLDSETRNLEKIMLELEEQKDNLLAQTKTQEEKAERKMVTERRERQWFERYRWFVTSDGKLALGGRDSTSNSIVINKYVTKNDVVFHADLHGSPFFVLRNRDQQSAAPPDEIALELSQATVGFSRAWKDELGSADAYWVYPDQIKKGAPSGEYLPRGSFFIEGRKNFVRHVKVELSVGIMSNSDLPENDAKALDESNENEKPADSHALLVVCGPEKSIANYCYSTVRIAPGKEKASHFARRLKQQLVNKIKEANVKESSKKLQLDDIMRVLPSGTYKFVVEKQNR